MELAMKEGADLDKIDFYKPDINTSFEFFKIGSRLVKDLETLQRVTYEIIEDYHKQNTRYLELRSTPKELGGKSKQDYIQAINEVIESALYDFPKIKVRYVMSVNRQCGIDAAKESLAVALGNNKYLVGIELSGDPRYGKFDEFAELFE
jgi:adenosine deaminase